MKTGGWLLQNISSLWLPLLFVERHWLFMNAGRDQ